MAEIWFFLDVSMISPTPAFPSLLSLGFQSLLFPSSALVWQDISQGPLPSTAPGIVSFPTRTERPLLPTKATPYSQPEAMWARPAPKGSVKAWRARAQRCGLRLAHILLSSAGWTRHLILSAASSLQKSALLSYRSPLHAVFVEEEREMHRWHQTSV